MTEPAPEPVQLATARRLRPRHGIVMADVARDASLSTTARALYAVLCTYADAEGTCYPSLFTLGADLGVTKRTTLDARKELVTAGYLRVTPRAHPSGRQARTFYQLDDDVRVSSATPLRVSSATPLEAGKGVADRAGRVSSATPLRVSSATPRTTTKNHHAGAGAPAREATRPRYVQSPLMTDTSDRVAPPDFTGLREHLAAKRKTAGTQPPITETGATAI